MKTEKEMFEGKLIAIEGIDGSGKSTLAESLKTYLSRKGHKVKLFHDPGTTAINAKLREILKYGVDGDHLTVLSELAMFMICRHEMVKKIIEPALEEGYTVITDRYQLSTDAYQGAGLGLQEPLERLKQLFKIREPDCTLIVDVDLEVASERLSGRDPNGADWIESRGVKYFNKVRDGFLEPSEKKGHFLIDGNQKPETVLSDACFIVNNFIGIPAVGHIKGVLESMKQVRGRNEEKTLESLLNDSRANSLRKETNKPI